MPEEKIELEDVFEPEEVPEETLEDLLSQMPDPMAASVKAFSMLINPKPKPSPGGLAGGIMVPWMVKQSYKTIHVDLSSPADALAIQETLNEGWMMGLQSLCGDRFAIVVFTKPAEEN